MPEPFGSFGWICVYSRQPSSYLADLLPARRPSHDPSAMQPFLSPATAPHRAARSHNAVPRQQRVLHKLQRRTCSSTLLFAATLTLHGHQLLHARIQTCKRRCDTPESVLVRVAKFPKLESEEAWAISVGGYRELCDGAHALSPSDYVRDRTRLWHLFNLLDFQEGSCCRSARAEVLPGR